MVKPPEPLFENTTFWKSQVPWAIAAVSLAFIVYTVLGYIHG